MKMVLQFCCGMSNDMGSSLTDHIASVGAESAQSIVKYFDWPSMVYRGEDVQFQFLHNQPGNPVRASLMPR